MSVATSSRPVVVAIGANIGSQDEILQRFAEVRAQLEELFGSSIRSSWWKSAPQGPVVDQAAFVNGVLLFHPSAPLSPLQILRELQRVEQERGRVRSVAGGPRTLDLDLLFVGCDEVKEEELTLPHPRWAERAFVLLPLRELLGGEFRFQNGAPSIDELLGRPALRAQELEIVEERNG